MIWLIIVLILLVAYEMAFASEQDDPYMKM